MSHDLVIRNGTVVDGTGLPRYRADVAIDDGRITQIGRVHERGDEEIDATDHVVTPGFVDGHTHMDAQLFWDPLGTCSCYHGVTTVVMGNCGFTLAPVRPDAHALVIRNLERAEDISPAALAAGIHWSWETFPEYLDVVDALPKGINYAANIGHSALRTWAMGERAFEHEATEDDLVTMERELDDALRAGAIGFTTSLTDQHETSDDRPVASRLASWDEVRRLVHVMGSLGVGTFELVPRIFMQSGLSIPEGSLEALRDLAIETGVPTNFGVGARRGPLDLITLIEETNAAGGRMFGLTHSRGVSVMMSFRSQMPFDRLPVWKDVRALEPDAQLHALADPAVRAQLVESATVHEYGRAIGAELRKPKYSAMRVIDRPVPPNPTVGELAAARGVDPVEIIIDLAIETELHQFFSQPIGSVSDDELLEVMKHPQTVMTFSDAGAHVSQIADSSIQTHLLAYWVRDRGAFTLEEAIRMLTLVPATAWNFADRGMVREGFVADLNVLDPATVGPEMPTIEHDLPAGAPRIVQRASGFLATVVGGRTVLRNGAPTGALPGRLLRNRLATGGRS